MSGGADREEGRVEELLRVNAALAAEVRNFSSGRGDALEGEVRRLRAGINGALRRLMARLPKPGRR